MNELALFAGAGGGILGGHLLGWRTICAVEQNKYAACVLAARQNDGILPPFPIWDDVRTFDGNPWRGVVDVISGGFPCQDISIAGKGAGINGARSGLWGEFARIIGEVRPRYVFIENSPMLTKRGGNRVITDLAALGYDAEWMCLSAAECGAPHKRDRFWLVGNTNDYGQIAHKECRGIAQGGNENETRAKQTRESARPSEQYAELADGGKDGGIGEIPHPNGEWELQPQGGEQNEWGRLGDSGEKPAHPDSAQREGGGVPLGAQQERPDTGGAGWWEVEPDVGRVANGVASRVDRLTTIGNGQVPIVAATAFKALLNAMDLSENGRKIDALKHATRLVETVARDILGESV